MIELLPWIITLIMTIILGLFILRYYFLQNCLKRICDELSEKTSDETNSLITVSYENRYIKNLTLELNKSLKELRAQRHRFVQGDKELKEAVTNISHDLRTPLTAVLGYMELLEAEEKSEKVERYLKIIENRILSMQQLMEELFDYSIISTMESGCTEKVELGRLLEENLLEFYGVFKEKEIIPQIKMPEQPVIRILNTVMVMRVFSNIISNALKYSDGDFSVNLSENGEIIFSNRAERLDAVTAEKLFNRFYTVENARNSTGLGLSIAKLLTERMGGSIKSDYEDNRLYIIVAFRE